MVVLRFNKNRFVDNFGIRNCTSYPTEPLNTTKMAFEKEKNKLIAEKCQAILTQLLKDEDNKYCVDCDAKSPRWASWNIGIFLCIRCAGIHRNLGVHISKVKSVNLDSWSPQQVACIEQMGNSRARAVYEANVDDNFRRPQTDSSLEQFIRAKYETKKYIAKEWVQPSLPNPNWEVDIERLLKKRKEKKSSQNAVDLPAPIKSDAPKSTTKPITLKNGPCKTMSSTATKISKLDDATKQVNQGSVVDLIGLDTPLDLDGATSVSNGISQDKDIFGDFLTAPGPPPGACESPKSAPNEESDFFNQKAPENASEKLTKDSILALYNQSPQSNLQHQAPNNGVSYGSNGIYMSGNNQLIGNLHQPAGIGGPYSQQGAPYPPAYYNVPGSNNPLGAYSTSNPCGIHAPTGFVAPPILLSPANPFSQMQHQMFNMSLGGPSLPPQGVNGNYGAPEVPPGVQTPSNDTLSSNFWQ